MQRSQQNSLRQNAFVFYLFKDSYFKWRTLLRVVLVFSTSSLYNEEMCQSSNPTPSSFGPSFADVAAGMDKNMGKN